VGSLDLGIISDLGETYPEYKQRQLIVGNYVMACMVNIIHACTGMTIHILWDKEDQFNIGESEEGYELKYDSRFRSTGNLYIEFMERTVNDVWINSGVYRGDNTKFYVIGDLEMMWVFKIETIREKVEEAGPYDGFALRRVPTGDNSAIGALLPVREVQSGLIGDEWVILDSPEPGLLIQNCLWPDGALYSVEEDPDVRSHFEEKAIAFIVGLRSWYGTGRRGYMPVPEDYGIDVEVEKLC